MTVASTDAEASVASISAELHRGCRCCGRAEVVTFHSMSSVPVHNSLLLDTPEAARGVAVGELELGCCPACGFIQNVRFDPELVSYAAGYEDTQAHSPRFVEFATSLTRGFEEHHGISDADVLEIGCGKGDFLRLVCSLTSSRGVGYDPAVGPGAMEDDDLDLRFVAESYDRSTRESADLVLCRHTLEHIPDVGTFVREVRESLRAQTPVVYFEVPDTLRVLRELAFWDLYYEHCSYFTPATLAALFERSGFDVLSTRLGFDDQYVLLEARPAPGADRMTPSDDAALASHAALMMAETATFAAGVDRLRDRWNESILRWKDDGRTIAIWGGSSKTVGFLAATGVADAVHSVVDINPRKHGMYLPGSALQVVAPDQLVDSGADVVIVMNPIYRNEIAESLQALGLNPELVTA